MFSMDSLLVIFITIRLPNVSWFCFKRSVYLYQISWIFSISSLGPPSFETLSDVDGLLGGPLACHGYCTRGRHPTGLTADTSSL